MKKLTQEFNTAAVQKGDTFQIEVIGGGFAGLYWQTEVVSGKATLLASDSHYPAAMGCDELVQVMTYRADEAGDIEIVAKTEHAFPKTFKVRAN